MSVRSEIPASSPGTVAADLSTGLDSPVRAASSTCRAFAPVTPALPGTLPPSPRRRPDPPDPPRPLPPFPDREQPPRPRFAVRNDRFPPRPDDGGGGCPGDRGQSPA